MLPIFESVSHRIYAAISFGFFLTTLFFIAAQVDRLSAIRLPLENNTLFYALFLLFGILAIGAVIYFSPRFEGRTFSSLILLIAMPAALVMAAGFTQSTNFHLFFQVGLGIYLICSGITLSAYAIGAARTTAPARPGLTVGAWFRQQGTPALLAVLFLTLLFFSFGFHRLGKYAAVDEPLWLYGRIGSYWNNIADGELQKTDVSDKPGITVSILSGAGLLQYDPNQFDDRRRDGEVFRKQRSMEDFFFAFRLPILIAVTLLLPLFYFLLERITGRGPALLAYSFLATSPILVGVAKIINPDALLWVFVPLSLLSYLAFQKRRAYRYLFLSGIFLGLGLLTKYIANILFVYLIGLLFLEFLYRPKTSAVAFSLHLRQSLIHLLMAVFSAMAIFYVLLPATWVDPEELWTATLGSQAFTKVAPLFGLILIFLLLDQWLNRARLTTALLAFFGRLRLILAWLLGGVFLGSLLFVILDIYAGMRPFDFMELLGSPKTIATRSGFLGSFLTNFYPLAFGVTPFALLGLLAVPLFFLRRRFFVSPSLRLAFYLIIFILLYYVGATINSVGSIVRYQIIIFPLAAILSGIGLFHTLRFFERRFVLKRDTLVSAAVLLVGLSGAYTLFRTPFPLSYASALLPEQYYIDLKDMGPGSYEIAEKLNALPNAENLLIWTDKDGVCQFFVGRCKRGTGWKTISDDSYDYIVVSSAREARTTNMFRSRLEKDPETLPVSKYYQQTNEEFAIFINDRPSHYVKAFRYELKRENSGTPPEITELEPFPAEEEEE